MSRPVTVSVICEGYTEQTFIREVLAPSISSRNIFLEYPLLGKPGHKGGHVEFKRALSDISLFIKQRPNMIVSSMFDLYGIHHDWPGVSQIRREMTAIQKAELVERHTLEAVKTALPQFNIDRRFIPYICVHEFEALLFSAPTVLASHLSVNPIQIERILKECGEPEEINDKPDTAPSKRLEALLPGYKHSKTIKGKIIAEEIGVKTMRDNCPHFDAWVNRLEALAQ